MYYYEPECFRASAMWFKHKVGLSPVHTETTHLCCTAAAQLPQLASKFRFFFPAALI